MGLRPGSAPPLSPTELCATWNLHVLYDAACASGGPKPACTAETTNYYFQVQLVTTAAASAAASTTRLGANSPAGLTSLEKRKHV